MFCYLNGLLLCAVAIAVLSVCEQVCACNFELKEVNGTIQSTNTSCKWTIDNEKQAGQEIKYVVIFRITKLDLPCSSSNLTFYENGKRKRNFCGNQQPNRVHIISDSTLITVKYYRSRQFQGKGFYMEYFKVLKESICSPPKVKCENFCIPDSWKCNGISECGNGDDERNCAVCGNRFDDHINGNFHSPNFPNGYFNRMNCRWQIHASAGKKIIQLQFHKLELDTGDLIQCFNGTTKTNHPMYTFTSKTHPKDNIISNKDMLVIFTSNGTMPGKGFTASYQLNEYCLSNSWPCEQNRSSPCYQESQRCDGVWNCPNGRDEQGCGKCAHNRIPCEMKGIQCYQVKQRCNGQGDCPRNEDEMKCTSERCGPQNGSFLCHNSKCIRESWKCDGTDDCGDQSDESQCSGMASRKVITAAVVGALSCSLLLVIALGCTCRLHAIRMREIMGHSYMSPVSRVQNEIWARRSAPPLYDEAMQTSRPYNEMISAIEQALRNQESNANTEQLSDVELLDGAGNQASTATRGQNVQSDDELLDISDNRHPSSNLNDSLLDMNYDEEYDIGASNVEITLSAGASAQWRRNVGGGGKRRVENQPQVPDLGLNEENSPMEENDLDSFMDTASSVSDDINDVIKPSNSCDIETNDAISSGIKQENMSCPEPPSNNKGDTDMDLHVKKTTTATSVMTVVKKSDSDTEVMAIDAKQTEDEQLDKETNLTSNTKLDDSLEDNMEDCSDTIPLIS